MKYFISILLVSFLIVSATDTIAEPKLTRQFLIHNGLLTGAKYLSLPLSERNDVVTGIVEGMLVAPLLGAPDRQAYKLGQCLEGKDNTEIEIIITTFARNNPDRLLSNIGILAHTALSKACGGLN